MNNRHKPYQKNNKIINRRKIVTPLAEIDETWKAAHESHYWGPFLAKSKIINNNNNG